MGRRRVMPAALLAGLAALVSMLVLGPTAAQSQAPATASLTATDFEWTAPGGTTNVTVAAGGTVTFSYPAGISKHNAVFTAAQPRACTLDGDAGLTAAPLPAVATAPGWSGSCTFDAGVYPLVCSVHPGMTATITAVAPAGGGAPPPPPPPPPPGTAPPPPPPPPSSGGGPKLVAAASGVRLATIQHGTAVRGSIDVARTRSRLTVRALVRRTALTKTKRTGTTSVASFTRGSVGGKRVAFTLSLNALARSALRRSGRLAVSIEISVKPKSGKTFTSKRSVILRAR